MRTLSNNADETIALETALGKSTVRWIYLVNLDLDTPVYLSNSYTVSWDNHLWLGLGVLGVISPIEEGTELQMYGVTLTISGIPLDTLDDAFNTNYQGRSAKIWLALLGDNSQIINSPILVFSGRMDTMNIELGSTAAISISIESKLTDWGRARVLKYTHEDQQLLYPGDKGLEFVSKIEEKEVLWGRM